MTPEEAVDAARAGALARVDGGMAVLVAFMASEVCRSRSARTKAKVRTARGAWLSIDPGRLTLVDTDEGLARLEPLFAHLRRTTPCV